MMRLVGFNFIDGPRVPTEPSKDSHWRKLSVIGTNRGTLTFATMRFTRMIPVSRLRWVWVAENPSRPKKQSSE
jgi:hypothetical protein